VEWLRFEGLERSYGARRVFEGLAGELADGVKVGLVGPNGAGKSSLVRILAGVEPPDTGRVVRTKDGRLGYLTQAASEERGAAEGRTLGDLLAEAFARIHEDEAKLRVMEIELGAAGDDMERLERALERYGEAREAFERHGGENLERRMRSMLAQFGFSEDDLARPTSDFSGGQRTKAALARMLLEEPDYLILDEPTNHLDLETVRWLEDFLNDDPRATLVVSHDRTFLDTVSSEIWELDRGKLERYVVKRGRAYGHYLEIKAERRELAERAYAKAVAEEKRREAVIAELRTHGSHNYSHVKSREKQLAKVDRAEAPEEQRRGISVALASSRRATNGLAVTAKGLSKAYGAPLFRDVSFELARGERLAIVGPNGAGKSTMLGILSGRGKPDAGTVKIADGVTFATYAQDAADDLPPGVSATDAVMDGSDVIPEVARGLLGRLGLGGDATDKPVEAFSGGERRRIMLARLMARKVDLMFLDEPTNDLDIPSREALEEVLAAYGGAIVVVSHDRYLLRRLAQRVLRIADGKASLLPDDFARYEERERAGFYSSVPEAPPKRRAPEPPPPPATPQQADRELRVAKERAAKQIAVCEREVAKLDAERARLEDEFADPAVYGDRSRAAELKAELDRTTHALETAYAKWESLLQTA